MAKLSPKIKIGCPICGEFDLDIKDDNIKLSEPKRNQITTIYNTPKQPKKLNTKVISLF